VEGEYIGVILAMDDMINNKDFQGGLKNEKTLIANLVKQYLQGPRKGSASKNIYVKSGSIDFIDISIWKQSISDPYMG